VDRRGRRRPWFRAVDVEEYRVDLVSAVPAQYMLVAVIVVFSALAVGCHSVIQRSFKDVDFIGHNEVGGVLVGVVGTIYAVLLGFVTVVVWERFNDAADRFSGEAGSTAAVWHLVAGLPSANALRIRSGAQQYFNAVIVEELPAMSRGHESLAADRALRELLRDVTTLKPHDAGEANVQLRMLQRLNDIWDDRNKRLESNESGISWLLWTALAISTAAVFGFSFLFGMESRRTHLIMTAILAAIASTLFTVLIELNYPFRGNITVPFNAWTTVRAEMKTDRS
jgi:hypothetical protein